jgi:hypothetical protein
MFFSKNMENLKQSGSILIPIQYGPYSMAHTPSEKNFLSIH